MKHYPYPFSLPCVVLFTGLPASGKTTLAQSFLEKYEKQLSIKILDGDEARKKTPHLGFGKEDRLLNLSNLAQMASELEKNGHVVLVAAISPYEEARKYARSQCHKFYELYLSTPLKICISRDPKGLYKKALAGEIKNFTGISDPYEIPMRPDLIIDTSSEEIATSLDKLYHLIQKSQK